MLTAAAVRAEEAAGSPRQDASPNSVEQADLAASGRDLFMAAVSGGDLGEVA